jgi:ribulose-phosphate 3-epimerase
MDGRFVRNIAFGIDFVKRICSSTDLPVSVHMMVDEPSPFVSAVACENVESVIVHREISDNLSDALNNIKNAGLGVGLAINPMTKVSDIENYASIIDTVLVMGVHPGFGGQTMLPEIPDKIDSLIAICEGNMSISIDGGVNSDTVNLVRIREDDTLIAGNYLFERTDENKVVGLKEKIKTLCCGISTGQ